MIAMSSENPGVGVFRLSLRAGALAVCLVAVAATLSAARAAHASYPSCPAWVASSPAKAGASVSYRPRGVAVGPTRATVSVQVAPTAGAKLVVQYGRGNVYLACSAVQDAAKNSLLVTGLLPDSTYRFRVVAKTRAGVVFGGARTLRTLPAGHVPEGVEIGGVAIGGMSRDQARAVLQRPLASPLRLSYAGAFWSVSRAKIGASLDVATALNAALTASPGTRLPPLKVVADPAAVKDYVSSLAERWRRTAAASGVELVGTHAVVTPVQGSVAIQTQHMVGAITRALTAARQGVIPLAVVRKPPPTSGSLAQKAVVIREGSQTLTAYLNGRAVLKTPVTTGRPALPTPIGSYFVHYRASPYTFISPWPPGSPYYYPPATVTWAMYFFDNDFLHDDPAEPSSAYGAGSQYGAYASHGCVHVPHSVMAWLYDWLPVGAPVIVSQT
jgi:lipoprotein-anchoring transpeptidase ErfK/SrfK